MDLSACLVRVVPLAALKSCGSSTVQTGASSSAAGAGAAPPARSSHKTSAARANHPKVARMGGILWNGSDHYPISGDEALGCNEKAGVRGSENGLAVHR